MAEAAGASLAFAARHQGRDAGTGSRRKWKNARTFQAASQPKHERVVGKAAAALQQVWGSLPTSAQALISDAGYTPQRSHPLPALQQGGRDSDAEVVDKRAALKVQLKEAVLEAVEPEIPKPEGPVTLQSAIASAAKADKSAAVELKDLMVQQGRIQDKINKSKAALEALYREMQTLTQRIQSQQQAVSEQLQALQDLTPAEEPATHQVDFDLCQVLSSLGVSLNEEQAATIQSMQAGRPKHDDAPEKPRQEVVKHSRLMAWPVRAAPHQGAAKRGPRLRVGCRGCGS